METQAEVTGDMWVLGYDLMGGGTGVDTWLSRLGEAFLGGGGGGEGGGGVAGVGKHCIGSDRILLIVFRQ